jgi:hypothetical protein
MKRLHIHVSVEDLAQSIGFYSILFAAYFLQLSQWYRRPIMPNGCFTIHA